MWANRNSIFFAEFLDALTRHYGVDIYTPYEQLPQAFKKVLLYGSGDEKILFYTDRGKRRRKISKQYEGIIPGLKRRYVETDSSYSRDEIRRYMTFRPCPDCKGTKLNPASRSVKVGDLGIHEVSALSISAAARFFANLKMTGKKEIIARRILKEIDERLGFLENVGLSYLTLDRAAYTLSGGESQRIRLATQIAPN